VTVMRSDSTCGLSWVSSRRSVGSRSREATTCYIITVAPVPAADLDVANNIQIALFAHVDLIEDEWGGLPALDSSLRINGQWRVFEISSGDSDDGANGESGQWWSLGTPRDEEQPWRGPRWEPGRVIRLDSVAARV